MSGISANQTSSRARQLRRTHNRHGRCEHLSAMAEDSILGSGPSTRRRNALELAAPIIVASVALEDFMETRMLGRLWPVSALTLGGGGVGQLWVPTTRDECIATVRTAVDCGIRCSTWPRPTATARRRALWARLRWPAARRHSSDDQAPAWHAPRRRGRRQYGLQHGVYDAE